MNTLKNNDKIPTNHGNLTPQEIIHTLTYNSYERCRDEGCSHETLAKWGLGNEAMKKRYETERN